MTVMPEPGGPGGPLAPQYLADQLTLFQPGRADYPHLFLLAPQCFSPSGITALYSVAFTLEPKRESATKIKRESVYKIHQVKIIITEGCLLLGF